MWSTVELHEIRVFLTLAEELHFGRTAERLHLTSSRISQVLRTLEAKLDAQLFHRTSRRVELTARGERFRKEVAGPLGQLTAVLQHTHAESAELDGTLRIGQLTPDVEGPNMPRITSAFQERFPECSVELSRAPYGEAFESLRRGEFDLLASWLPHGQTDVVVGPTLTREQLFLGVAEDHPLSQHDHLSIEDVADYQVLPMEQVQPMALVERWIPRQTPSGRTIHRFRVPFRHMAQEDPGALRGQISWWIRTGQIVHPVMDRVRDLHGPGIVWVLISDMAPLTSALVWLGGVSNRRVREFVRVAEDILQPKESQGDGRGRGEKRSSTRATSGRASHKLG